jgi:hypothetical protein
VVALEVAELVGEHDPQLGPREVDDRVPQHDLAAGPQPERVGVGLARELAHVLDADRHVLHALTGGDALGVGADRRARLLQVGHEPRADERERREERDERRRGRRPPRPAQEARQRHHDQQRRAREEELAAEAEEVVEEVLEVARVDHVVVAQPPQLDQPEGDRRQPREGEPEHAEQEARADAAGRGLLDEARALARVDDEDGERDELAGEELPAQEGLEGLGLVQLARGELLRGVEVGQLQAGRHLRVPQRVRGPHPGRGQRREGDQPEDQARSHAPGPLYG